MLSPPQQEQEQEERRQARAGPPPDGATRWRARAVAEWRAERVGRPVATQRGGDSLQRLKPRPQLPRPRHALAAAEQQDACKKK